MPNRTASSHLRQERIAHPHRYNQSDPHSANEQKPSEARPPQPLISGRVPGSMLPVRIQNLTTVHRSLTTAAKPPRPPNRNSAHPSFPILKGAFQKPRQPRAPASKRPGNQKASEARPSQPPTSGRVPGSMIPVLIRNLATVHRSPTTAAKPSRPNRPRRAQSQSLSVSISFTSNAVTAPLS